MSSQPNEVGHICGSSGDVSGLSGGPIIDIGNIFALHNCLMQEF
jgi:hypothetical protein